MTRLAYLCARPQQGAAEAEYASFRTATGRADLQRWDLVAQPLPSDALARWDGFVVGGSPFNVTDPESTKTEVQLRIEADLTRLAAHAATGETAVLFTCYGIGIATRALGGEVSRAFPEDTGPTHVALTDAAQTDRVFGGLADTFSVLTAHKEGTATLPPGAVLLAGNDACPVQAYRVGDRLYATQFHPEPTAQAFTERMAVYRDDGYFDARDYETISARVRAATLTEPPRILRAFAAGV